MQAFNNREIATAFWLLAFATWVLRKPDVRHSLTAGLRAACHIKIVASVCVMLLYTAAAVGLLTMLGLWKVGLLKDTIVWFGVSAMAMMVRFVASDHRGSILRKVVFDSVKIVIILEFLLNTYTFSLPVELILVPLLTLIAAAGAIAGLDTKHSAVAHFTPTLHKPKPVAG